MKEQPVWMYMETGVTRHIFFSKKHKMAICGTAILSYLPATYGWKTDEEGLKKRRPCKRCMLLSRREERL